MSGLAAAHRIEDPIAFARAAGLQCGQVAIVALSRLHDRLGQEAGNVKYAARGRLDQRQRPSLELEITGILGLRCDRCLAPLDFPLYLQSRVLLMPPGVAPQDDDDPESPEWVEAGQELNLQLLVEDEILLGLPLSVRHSEGNCSSGMDRMMKRNTPFSGLAMLLQSRQTKTN